ncbi:protein artichoke [Neocloeon triangulifer]|uniref:protein artichoke n=1 Tax=Neocloeon triangulifer TaxID=2078957 RepID=UPI00286F6D22|nr:protein artichoke [Neocloeon triangulifer]
MCVLRLGLFLLVIGAPVVVLGQQASVSGEEACAELLTDLRHPCTCIYDDSQDLELELDCDRVVFGVDFPVLPFGAALRSFSQRHVGLQGLPAQAFSGREIALTRLDYSDNLLRRLTERSLDGVRETLKELVLRDNLLGDTLNPIFSSGELRGLTNLQVLDLRGNQLRGLEAGFVKGCPNLQELLLDRNLLSAVPSASLNGPKALKAITLSRNRIDIIRRDGFWAQPRLELVDLSSNGIRVVEGGAFVALTQLRALRLPHNRLTRLSSDTFQGADSMEVLDLAENFLGDFPTVALKPLTKLRALNLSANLIQTLNNADLASHPDLEILDLSRNSLASLAPGTFVGLRKLRKLYLHVNSLRTIEDDTFEGLEKLEFLSLEDNNVLLVPTSALGRLPRLAALNLGFNRVAALNEALLKPAAHVQMLSLQFNVIREIPSNAFSNFSRLTKLDLGGNQLQVASPATFAGLEATLEELILQDNKIVSLSPLALPALRRLSMARNYLTEVQAGALRLLPSLEELDLSGNPRLTNLPQAPFAGLGSLAILDLSNTGLTQLTPGLLVGLGGLLNVNLANCKITELQERSLSVLPQLDTLDLSGNEISNIKAGAFDNLPALRVLNISKNKLNSFKGEIFRHPENRSSAIEDLDLSGNDLQYLFPSSFSSHPNLVRMAVQNNKFTFFPSELLSGLRRLEFIDLSGNQLSSVDELNFASLPRLREIILKGNKIEHFSEAAFRNSSQIQIIDMSSNKLNRIEERSFEGFNRLMLNLDNNQLNDLPETLFDRSKIHILEEISLAGNKFEMAPLPALQRQYFYLNKVNLANNKIINLPADDTMLVNIKKFDISFNPLSTESVNSLLEEPKTVRELNLAGTGIRSLPETLETPFLRSLNVSQNQITSIPKTVFYRSTLLEKLDISNNRLNKATLPPLTNLQELDMSNNPIEIVYPTDLANITNLKVLKLKNLEVLSRLEAGALQPLSNLEELEAYGYPRLGYLDVKGILSVLPPLEKLDIEMKDAALSDQLAAARHPRMKEIGLRGPRVQQVASSGLLASMTAPTLTVKLRDTAITSLPPSLLLPVPRSTQLTLDVSDSKLTSLAGPLLSALDSRKNRLNVVGVDSNPIKCDCNSVLFQRWLLSHPDMPAVKCESPVDLQGESLQTLPEEELICGVRSTKPPPTTTTSSTTQRASTTAEPEIIWSVAATTTKSRNKDPETTQRPIKSAGSSSSIANDDTLIIGIVGGVVAFILLLIIIICIARCRMSSASRYQGGPLAAPPMFPMPPSCTCVKPPPSSIYMSPYSAKGYPAGGQPYYISYPPEEMNMQNMHMDMHYAESVRESMRGEQQ